MPKMLRKYQLKGIKSQRKNYKNICRLYILRRFIFYHELSQLNNHGQYTSRSTSCSVETTREQSYRMPS